MLARALDQRLNVTGIGEIGPYGLRIGQVDSCIGQPLQKACSAIQTVGAKTRDGGTGERPQRVSGSGRKQVLPLPGDRGRADERHEVQRIIQELVEGAAKSLLRRELLHDFWRRVLAFAAGCFSKFPRAPDVLGALLVAPLAFLRDAVCRAQQAGQPCLGGVFALLVRQVVLGDVVRNPRGVDDIARGGSQVCVIGANAPGGVRLLEHAEVFPFLRHVGDAVRVLRLLQKVEGRRTHAHGVGLTAAPCGLFLLLVRRLPFECRSIGQVVRSRLGHALDDDAV